MVTATEVDRSAVNGNGFTERYQTLLADLCREHEVELLCIAVGPELFAADEDVPFNCINHRVAVTGLETPFDLLKRAANIARGGSFAPWEAECRARIKKSSAEVTLCFSWAERHLFRAFVDDTASVFFVEEASGEHSEGPMPWRRRALARAVHAAERRAVSRAGAVVVISPNERPWAERAFKPSPVFEVPHRIEERYWSAPVDPASDVRRRDVFVIGHMGDPRNSSGLRAIAEQLCDLDPKQSPRLLVASWVPLGDELRCFPSHVLHDLGRVEDPRPFYRAAAATLVPSFQVGGAKTTILQGWATGCAVVTTEPAARSVGGRHEVDLLIGATPTEVAAQLKRVVNDLPLRDILQTGGRRSLATNHGPALSSANVRAAIDTAITRARRR